MARTNIVLDEALVTQGLKATGAKSRRELVDLALRELIRHANQMKLLELKGKIDWTGDISQSRANRDS